MKKLQYTTLLLFCILNVGAQHTPEQIRHIISKEFTEICKIHDTEEAFDTIWQRIDNYLIAAEKLSGDKRTPQITAEIAIWHNLKASLLASYLDEKQHILKKRTPLAPTETPPTDHQLWDVATFYRMILQEFYTSLQEQTTLIQIPLSTYAKLWELPLEKRCYATLYDLLAYNFVEFLTHDSQEGLLVNDTFNLNQPDFFAPQLPALTCPNSLSINYHFLHLMDEIARAHAADTSSIYQNYNYLVRVRYVQRHATFSQRDSLFLTALQQMLTTTPEKEILRQLIYGELAQFYHRKSEEATTHRDALMQAVEWYRRAIAVAPNSRLTDNFRSAISTITQPEALIQTQQQLYPEETFAQIISRNCDNAYFAIARLRKEAEPTWEGNQTSITLNLIENKKITVKSEHLHREDTSLVIIPALTPGYYLFLTSPTPIAATITNREYYEMCAVHVTVSRLGSRYVITDKEAQVWVYDTKSGVPLPDVKVTLHLENGRTEKPFCAEETISNKDGYAAIPLQKFYQVWNHHYWENFYLSISKDDDVATKTRISLQEKEELRTEPTCYFFTDRTIYRPGQMVQWKVVLTNQKGYDETLLCHQSVLLTLKAENGTVILHDTVSTNEFGSAAGSWELPSSGYLGRYTIFASYKNQRIYPSYTFRVEEYKRPTFEVSLAQPTATFALDKAATITGTATAFAGYPLQAAAVSYRVVRRISLPFRWYQWWRPNGKTVPDKEIAHGNCQTDADGNFAITFTAESVARANSNSYLYTFTVYATVTDLAGETHEAQLPIRISQRTLQFDVDMPDYLLATHKPLAVRVLNLAGEVQTADVQYSVVQLLTPDSYRMPLPFNLPEVTDTFRQKFPQYAFQHENLPENWEENKIVAKGRLTTDEKSTLFIKALPQLPSGAYKLKLATTDNFGTEITDEWVFYWLQQKNDFPFYSPLKIITPTEEAKVGDTICFHIGSYLANQHLFIRISNNDKLLENKWIQVNKDSYTFSHVVKEGEEGTFTCLAYTTWNGENHDYSSQVAVPPTKRIIHFEFETFRDKLLPGAHEQVKISLKDAAGNPLPPTELLCLMYDAALDAFAPRHTPRPLFPFNRPTLQPLRWLTDYYRLQLVTHFNYSYDIPDEDFLFNFPTWKILPSLFGYLVYEECRFLNSAKSTAEVRTMNCEIVADGIALKDAIENEELAPPPTVEPRSNFNETAFFYPHLRTQNGIIEFAYTIPESLTKWKMLGAAHTDQQQFGYFEKIVQTQKPLMVRPNTPRFVYEEDSILFSATIVTTETISPTATATLELFDAANDTVFHIALQVVNIDSAATTAVSFPVKIPRGLTHLRYQIMVEATADSYTYRDGETQMLPVLTRRQLLTETLPIFITKKGTKSFSFNDLPAIDEEIVSGKLQFTPTPLWNVLLALPYLVDYPYDCNEQLFSKLYANIVATHIADQQPQLRQLMENMAQNYPDILRSNLSQNADLKQILLEETPWVADACNEDSDIQNVANLFNHAAITKQQRQIVQKLEQNQNHDGGWCWFASEKTQTSSTYITQHLLIGAGRLMAKNVCKEGENFLKKSTLKKAINFIDTYNQKEYQRIKQKTPALLDSNCLAPNILHYLYAKSFYGGGNSEAYKFYKKQLKKYAPKLPTIYQKTMAALTLFQTNEDGDRTLARQLMNDIMKYAIVSEELGMYWKKEGYGWFWYDAPIERQALLIEATQTILHDTAAVNAMKVWLLQQKRTQHWESTRATADACFALLLNEAAPTNRPDNWVTVAVGEKEFRFTDTIQPPVKQDITPYLPTDSAAPIVLSRSQDALSYGGVFVQYYKDIDAIESTAASQPLAVQRQLYRETPSEAGVQLAAVSENTPLHVGDKVRVRLTLRTDRDMEFVHLKDLRAAAFEPTETLSGYRWQSGLGYYQSTRDASVNLFFHWLPKGTYLFEYQIFVTQSGTFSSGYATAQCLYAPEFSAHSSGGKRPLTIFRE